MKYFPLLYENREAWLLSETKKITLIGMSGLGKTFISHILHVKHGWLHYSVDFRIGSNYLHESIFKTCDKTKKSSNERNFSIKDLSLLSKYLGKPGNPSANGLDFAEYMKRQKEHRVAEISSMLDIPDYIATHLQPPKTNFVCDTSGSLCEIVDPQDPKDPILSNIAEQTLIILIKETDSQMKELKDRFKKDPKPMYYKEDFLSKTWRDFCVKKNVTGNQVDPDEFSLYGFEKLISHRRPIYNLIAKNWGIEIPFTAINKIKSAVDLNKLIYQSLPETKE